jgi:glycosyltransferase involved in cell wall biosynthesis
VTAVALAHDYLTQRGGAERVALLMAQTFPQAPLYTSVYEPAQTFGAFDRVDVKTSLLQHVKPLRRDPRLALPLLKHVWNTTRAENAEAVLVSSTGWAHGIQAPSGVPLIVYCHNPARWLYQLDEYETSPLRRAMLRPLARQLRDWDRSAALRASLYLANSTVVKARIKNVYGIEAELLHPPVSVDVDGPREPVPGVQPGYWLSIARGRGYKNVEAVIEAVGRRPEQHLVVVGSPPAEASNVPNVTWLGIVSEARLRWLYANARALVSVSQEDFGLTPIEANAFGTPVAVVRAGGFLDSTAEGRSGVFIEDSTADAVEAVLSNFPEFDRGLVEANAERFSASNFAAKLQGFVKQYAGA